MRRIIGKIIQRFTPKMIQGNRADSPLTVNNRLWFLRENRFLFMTKNGPVEITVKPTYVISAAVVCFVGTVVIAISTVFLGVNAVGVVSRDSIQTANASITETDMDADNFNDTLEVIALAPQTETSTAQPASGSFIKDLSTGADKKQKPFAPKSDGMNASKNTFARIISKRDRVNALPTAGNSDAMDTANVLAEKVTDDQPMFEADNSVTLPKLADAPQAPVRPIEPVDDAKPAQIQKSPRERAAIELAALSNLIPDFAFNSFYNKDTLNEPDNADEQPLHRPKPDTISSITNIKQTVPPIGDAPVGMEKIEPKRMVPEIDSAVQEMKLLVSMVREIDTIRSRVANLGLLEENLPDYDSVGPALDNKDFKTLVLALDDHRSALRKIPFKPPMLYFYISSNYGYRKHPVTKKKVFHHGIDLAGTWQEDILASAPGTVTFAGKAGSFGNVVRVRHAFGVETVFAHLSKIRVKKDQDVSEGTVIGNMGRTGRTEGAHLHYEMRVNGESLNPQLFFDVGRAMSVSGELRVVSTDR
ncbi:M23 family metallopeptidase [Candidatus Puniceispirillum sp.]|uniref:M23 family metallopeptidase n=1 Tax=Candidatus Puniceispirillum sp. TaxID=2026719 RepID=UPI001EBB5998|nr:M23 family metallopeptidase [Candidatus Puniceispirillum sp.]